MNLGWKQIHFSHKDYDVTKYTTHRTRDIVIMVVMIISVLFIGSLAQ